MKMYSSLSDRLKTQHEVIQVIITNIDKELIIARPVQNKWSIHDNIAHLSRYQDIFIKKDNVDPGRN